MISNFLQVNFALFFEKYNDVLVQSESYVTKRQSIKLLGEILLDRSNYNVMTTYVDSGDHLKIIMKLLRDDRRMINYEGFHVFKVRPPHGDILGFYAFWQTSPAMIPPSYTLSGLCSQPEQVSRGPAHPNQQPRQAPSLPPHFPRR